MKKKSSQLSTEVKMNPATQQAEVLIAQAIEKNVPVETMERLLAMRTQLKQEYAKEQFDNAMATFQMKCPIIKKTTPGGETKAGKIAYYYATLDSILLQTKHLIADNGFSYAIKSDTKEKTVKATCIVKHSMGHAEESSVEVPLGTKTGVMSDSQQVAAALTFAKRYAFCNAFGILTGDQDIDGKKTSTGTDKMEKALSMVAKSTDPKGLEEYLKKLENSKMKAKDKKALMDAVKARIDELVMEHEKKIK